MTGGVEGLDCVIVEWLDTRTAGWGVWASPRAGWCGQAQGSRHVKVDDLPSPAAARLALARLLEWGGMSDAFCAVPPAEPKLAAVPSETASVAIGVLHPGVRLVGLSKGQISILDLIEAVLWQTGPADVVCSAWTTGDMEIERLASLSRRGKVRALTMILDFSFVRQKPERAARLAEVFGTSAFLITHNHAKFALIANDSWHVVIRTSANMNRNPRLEQFDIDDSLPIWAFFTAHVDELRGQSPAWDQPHSDTGAQFHRQMAGLAEAYPAERADKGKSLEDLVKRWQGRL